MSLVYAHEILSQCDVYFLNGGHFSKFLYLALLSTWLNLESSYLAQLCTYTGATHTEEIIYLSIILLKLWIFKKFTFYTFWLIGKHAKDTKFISGTPHTDTCIYTDTCTHRQIPILHLTNLIFGTPHTHKYTQTHAHTGDRYIFGSFGNEPMQSWFVHHVSLASSSLLSSSASLSLSLVLSVYSSPTNSFDHRNSISCKYIYLYP